MDVAEDVSDRIGAARAAASSTRDAAGGASGVYRMGVAGRFAAATRDGAADREAAVAVIDGGLAGLRADLARAAAGANASALGAWTSADGEATWARWEQFKERHRSSAMPAPAWLEYAHWYERVRWMRGLARIQGVRLDSPEPDPLPSGDEQGTPASTLWTTGKVALYAAAAVTGALALRSALRVLLGGREAEPT